ncbi:MAG: ArnT family glycosyltransferase, partial [Metallibacterium scheffleri]
MTGTRQRRALWLVLLALWLGLWFAGSQYRSLLEPDEGRYAEVPREMVASGNWVTPRYDGVLFLDKPALQYWGTALAYEAFGASNWTARLWGLLTGLLGMLAVGWAGARAFGRVAGWSAAAVLGSSLLWVVGSHLNTLDMGVAALLGTSLCTFILAQLPDASVRAQRGWMLLTWLAMAAAFLSKGLIGIVFPGGALFFYMLWTGQWHLLRRMQWLLGLSLFLLLVLPWYIALQLRHEQFLHYFFIGQQFTRYLSDRFDRSHPFWFF